MNSTRDNLDANLYLASTELEIAQADIFSRERAYEDAKRAGTLQQLQIPVVIEPGGISTTNGENSDINRARTEAFYA